MENKCKAFEKELQELEKRYGLKLVDADTGFCGVALVEEGKSLEESEWYFIGEEGGV